MLATSDPLEMHSLPKISPSSSSSVSVPSPSYHLFNSLSLFSTNNVTTEWDFNHHHLHQHQHQHPPHQHQHHHRLQYRHPHSSSSSSSNSSSKEDILPTNQGLITDFGSSSTHSPKEDFYDDYYLKPRDSIDIVSADTVKYQLKDALDTIQLLGQRLSLLTDDLQQKQQTIHTLQSTIVAKDLEIQEQSHRLAALHKACESRSTMYGNDTVADRFTLVTRENAELKYKQKLLLQQLELTRNRQSKAPSPPPESASLDPLNKWQRWSDEKNTDTKRRLDKNSNTDWDSMVSRILRMTDQQASLYLQQKLKTCTLEQKQEIFEAVYREAYALMTNRFGNFLVQRLFEMGTPEQVRSLAHKMKGHILALTCESFGCHVVQKALDYVDEKTKAELVTELFERIPDTITHKSACHVWQKVFEIRWVHHSISVMSHVYDALKGKWSQVALDETGSLIIQNIFENLPEQDKRPVLNEILDNMFTIARGQWGNWVIQHILEQAEHSKDRELAFNMVLERGIQLSMDQFASKVVEKALSIGGPCYMSKFIHHISTESRSHRPRIALIDIASDQYGNYVIQWIINNASHHHKIDVCRLIKRHMVSLRGSKYGQRVAFLVEKALKHHEITTYPSKA